MIDQKFDEFFNKDGMKTDDAAAMPDEIHVEQFPHKVIHSENVIFDLKAGTMKTESELEVERLTAQVEAQAKIIEKQRIALERIRDADYRGNRSTESQIAYEVLQELGS